MIDCTNIKWFDITELLQVCVFVLKARELALIHTSPSNTNCMQRKISLFVLAQGARLVEALLVFTEFKPVLLFWRDVHYHVDLALGTATRRYINIKLLLLYYCEKMLRLWIGLIIKQKMFSRKGGRKHPMLNSLRAVKNHSAWDIFIYISYLI